jgi:hypothetical protein
MERQFLENLHDSHDRSHFIPDDDIAHILDRRPTALNKLTTHLLAKLGNLLITWGSHLQEKETIVPAKTGGSPTPC